MNIYLACTAMGILAMLLTQVVIVQKQRKKYKVANLIWEWPVYWKGDFIFQILGTIITIGMGLILLVYFLQQFPAVKNTPFFVASFFGFVGYTGTDSATKFFSVINSRYSSAIDYKTDIADNLTGNAGTPTPAAKPPQQ